MKKILFVTPFFAPAYSYGGIVRVAYDQAKGLVKNGYDLTVITTDVFDSKNRNTIMNETIEGIKIIRFKNISNHLAKFQNLYLPIGMKKWIKNNILKYDIVHIHDVYNLPTFWAGKYAYENKIKYFIQPHGTLSGVSINSRKKGIKYWILKKIKNYFDNADGLFGLTQLEIEDIKKVTNNKNIFELPNGIDLNKFKEIKSYDIRKKYNLTKETKIITFLGRIQYIKGLDISFNILAELNKKFKNWRFLIIGPDEGEKQNLVELSKKIGIDDKIIWYGEENSKKKYELLKGSDVFLFNSRSEGFGLTILESIISGLPILISDNCPISELQNYNIGYKLSNNNTIEFVLKLLEIFENKTQYQNNLYKYILDNYESNNINLQLINYYEKNNHNP